MACVTWLRRDYLISHGREPDEPPCDHSPDDCTALDVLLHLVPNPPSEPERNHDDDHH